MARKIRGLFAPLTQELGFDPRFKNLKQLEKLVFLLILYTAHMTNNRAPADARYYRQMFNLQARPYQVASAVQAVMEQYPKLVAKDKILSFVNMPIYVNGVAPKRAVEEEEEEEEEEDGNGTNNKHKEFVMFWCKEFEKRYSSKYVFQSSKDGQIVKRLLGTHPFDNLKLLAEAFFDDQDPFVLKAGRTLGVFSTQINRLSQNMNVIKFRKAVKDGSGKS